MFVHYIHRHSIVYHTLMFLRPNIVHFHSLMRWWRNILHPEKCYKKEAKKQEFQYILSHDLLKRRAKRTVREFKNHTTVDSDNLSVIRILYIISSPTWSGKTVLLLYALIYWITMFFIAVVRLLPPRKKPNPLEFR